MKHSFRSKYTDMARPIRHIGDRTFGTSGSFTLSFAVPSGLTTEHRIL